MVDVLDRSWQVIVMALPFYMAALGMLGLSAMLWRWRGEPRVGWLMVLLGTAAVWPLTVGLEMMVGDWGWKQALARMRPGTNLVTTAVHFGLCVEFAGVWKRQRRWVYGGLAGLTGVMIVLSGLPGQIWFEAAAEFPHRLVFRHGEFGRLYPAVAEMLVLGGVVVMATEWRRRSRAYRSAVVALAVGAPAAAVIDILFELGMTPMKGMNFSALGLCVSGVAWAWVVYQCDVLNIVALGRAGVLETLPDPVFILDRRGRVTDLNEGAVATLGGKKGDWRGRRAAELGEPWAGLIGSGASGQRAVGGRVYDVSRMVVGEEAGQVVRLHDVTEALEARRQLGEYHRMDLMGRMAARMAEEFDTTLRVVMKEAEGLARLGSLTGAGQGAVERILKAGARAEGMTRQLRLLGGGEELKAGLVEVGGLVREVEGLLRQVAGPGVEVEVEGGEGLVRVERRRLVEAVMEAVGNASEAMGGKGRVWVKSGRKGEVVQVEVEDDGPGVKGGYEQVFDAFYTTGGSERLGLGLAVVRRFAQQSGGRAWMEGREGGGARLVLEFPAE